MSDSTPEMTLMDHLGELRTRLIRCAYAVLAATLAAFYFHEKIFDIIRAPIQPHLAAGVGGLIFTSPMDKFLAAIKISVMVGVIAAAPFILYQIWRFVAPGLYSHEKKYSILFVASGSVLFLVGVLFVYFLVFPAAFQFLLSFGGTTDKPMITINEYLSFFLTTTLVFGAAFELPLVITLLGIIGIVDASFLRKQRRYAIVGIGIVSAIVTPPDVLSMLLLLVPMVILYEISILIVSAVEKRRTQSIAAN